MKLVVVMLGVAALALDPAPAEACGPSLTCASQFCTFNAHAVAEGTVARLDVAENNQFAVTLEDAEVAGEVQMTGTITVLADTQIVSVNDVGMPILFYVVRDDATGDLVVSERHTRAAFAEMECFDPAVPVAQIAEVVLAEDCYQTLPHDVDGCPENHFGCSAGGTPGALVVIGVVLVLARRRRR